MYNSIEELLEVDSFRQAVSGDQKALNRVFFVRWRHVSHAVATLVRRERQRERFAPEKAITRVLKFDERPIEASISADAGRYFSGGITAPDRTGQLLGQRPTQRRPKRFDIGRAAHRSGRYHRYGLLPP